VRCSRHELQADEIRSHLEAGKQVTRLALVLDEHVSFVLGEDLVLRTLKFLDGAVEQLENSERDSLHAELDARFALMAGELKRLFAVLEPALKSSRADARDRPRTAPASPHAPVAHAAPRATGRGNPAAAARRRPRSAGALGPAPARAPAAPAGRRARRPPDPAATRLDPRRRNLPARAPRLAGAAAGRARFHPPAAAGAVAGSAAAAARRVAAAALAARPLRPRHARHRRRAAATARTRRRAPGPGGAARVLQPAGPRRP